MHRVPGLEGVQYGYPARLVVDRSVEVLFPFPPLHRRALHQLDVGLVVPRVPHPANPLGHVGRGRVLVRNASLVENRHGVPTASQLDGGRHPKDTRPNDADLHCCAPPTKLAGKPSLHRIAVPVTRRTRLCRLPPAPLRSKTARSCPAHPHFRDGRVVFWGFPPGPRQRGKPGRLCGSGFTHTPGPRQRGKPLLKPLRNPSDLRYGPWNSDPSPGQEIDGRSVVYDNGLASCLNYGHRPQCMFAVPSS